MHYPDLQAETAAFAAGAPYVWGIDEVGRGALAGPVTVGAVALSAQLGAIPAGLADSKLLRPAIREKLVMPIQKWVSAWGVGHAQPAEIDKLGMTAALRRAGRRALHEACTSQESKFLTSECVIFLDGSHDWLSDPWDEGLFSENTPATEKLAPPVHMQIKGDLRCASIAAASVLAKVERDSLMVQAATEHPEYDWQSNKGYAAKTHMEAIAQRGPAALHRLSWKTFQ